MLEKIFMEKHLYVWKYIIMKETPVLDAFHSTSFHPFWYSITFAQSGESLLQSQPLTRNDLDQIQKFSEFDGIYIL